MKLRASAPGKVFLIGEYAVLSGSPALVAAVSVRARVEITARGAGDWSLTTRQAATTTQAITPGRPSGVKLFDVLVGELKIADGVTLPPADITLDTRAFFGAGGRKRGLGSSAALLVALHGALGQWARASQPSTAGEPLATLRRLHDRFQGSSGSGGDLAASLLGGVIRYRLDAAGKAETGSVTLPDGVAFACICTGQPASSARLVGLYHRWRVQCSDTAAALVGALDRHARAACRALAAGDGDGFLTAVAAYGDQLEELGGALGAELVTPAHHELKQLAEHNGVIYKLSGAGGGDVGVAFARDAQRLEAFVAQAVRAGFEHLDLDIETQGLTVAGNHD